MFQKAHSFYFSTASAQLMTVECAFVTLSHTVKLNAFIGWWHPYICTEMTFVFAIYSQHTHIHIHRCMCGFSLPV